MAMKLVTHKTILLVVITLSLAFLCSPLMAQVYKTVDEDGNVTYTDQPPTDGSKPVKLRPISVIEAPTYEDKSKAVEEGAEGEEGKEMSLRYLRKQYGDFAIVAPQPEESVWYSDNVIAVAWNARYQLQEGMQVTVSVDGKRQAATAEQIIAVTGLERGEHTVTAVLNDAKNRKIATAAPITFFIRQPGLYNRARPTPRGGG
jgi:hypothetical protein